MDYDLLWDRVKNLTLGESLSLPVESIPKSEETPTSWLQWVRFLESEGFAVALETDESPAVFIAEGLDESGRPKGWGLQHHTPKALKIIALGWPFRSRKPQKPLYEAPGLTLVPHHTMGAIFCREGAWGEPLLLPAGSFGLSIADTTGIQYAQAAFEGACAMRGEKEAVYGFRLEENAKRFQKSISALDLPILEAEKAEKLMEEVIRYNKAYVPPTGKGKLYIRPSVCGLDGGLGITIPRTSIITVEVAAFGDYFPDTIRIEGLKWISRPATGENKIAPNYGASFRIKHEVKERGYDDYLSFDACGAVEEVATCAIAFIDKSGRFVFPPVQDEIDKKPRHILPSITRKSIMEILKHLGKEVVIRDVYFEEIPEMEAAFTMGNAVGVIFVEEICLRNTPEDSGKKVTFKNPAHKDFVFSLKEKLYQARTGRLLGFESWARKL